MAELAGTPETQLLANEQQIELGATDVMVEMIMMAKLATEQQAARTLGAQLQAAGTLEKELRETGYRATGSGDTGDRAEGSWDS